MPTLILTFKPARQGGNLPLAFSLHDAQIKKPTLLVGFADKKKINLHSTTAGTWIADENMLCELAGTALLQIELRDAKQPSLYWMGSLGLEFHHHAGNLTVNVTGVANVGEKGAWGQVNEVNVNLNLPADAASDSSQWQQVEVHLRECRVVVSSVRQPRQDDSWVDDVPASFGHYERIAELGKGGFGMVYKVRHRRFGYEYALKVLDPRIAALPGERTRFLREAGALASLHAVPEVVTVHDLAQDDDPWCWLMMELVSGFPMADGQHCVTLAQELFWHEMKYIQRVGLGEERALHILEDVLNALHAVHARGIIHRDIKPGNILLTPQGGAKLSDFGLLKVVDDELATQYAALIKQINKSQGNHSASSGTVAYMSPEQEEGRALDARSDIYSLGMVLYEILTGHRPKGRFKMPHEMGLPVAAWWDDLLDQMLAMRPSDRPDSASVIKKCLRPEVAPVSTAIPQAPTSEMEINPDPEIDHLSSDPCIQSPWEFENSLGMKFVPVPVGEGKHILFSIWQTRRQDYEAYAKANSGVDDEWKNAEFKGEKVGRDPDHPDHPVVNINHNDAVAFCQWLTTKERANGKIRTNDEYRLPTDAEWSSAVGISAQQDANATQQEKDSNLKDVYPWGNAWPPPKGAGNYAPSLGCDSFIFTSPVGSFAANQFGLYDLGGNVWEWTSSCYNGISGTHAVRGGSWLNSGPGNLLSSVRYNYTSGLRNLWIGFRCVLEVSTR